MISWNLTEERRPCVSPNLRLPLTSPSYSPELSSFLLRNNSVLNVSSDLEFCCCRVRAGKLRRQTRDNLHHIVRFSFYTLTTDDNQWQCFMPPVVLHPYYFTWPYFRGVIVSEITAQSLQGKYGIIFMALPSYFMVQSAKTAGLLPDSDFSYRLQPTETFLPNISVHNILLVVGVFQVLFPI